MRGILIDPFTREVKEIDTSGSLIEIYNDLGVDVVTVLSIDMENALYLDDEGLLVPKESQEYWQWHGSNQPYAGRGLILGVLDDGDNSDSTMTAEEVASRVTFLDKANINPSDYTSWTVMTWSEE